MFNLIGPIRLHLKSIFITVFAAVFLLATACTEAPKNDGNAKASPVIPELGLTTPQKKLLDSLKLSSEVFSNPGEITGVGSVEEEALKQKNLREPIVYGIGAAGINMDTTFAESKKLLTPPFRGPFADGVTLYNEQVVVIWKDEGERKPAIIIPIKGYLGKLGAGKFGQLDFQTKFKDYKGDQPEAGAARLARELYLEFEQVDDQSYNCLATGRCRLIYGTENQANLVIVLPGAVFLIAKEEFQLAEIRIIRDIDPGMLANDLDVLSGDILVPEEQAFKLGQTHQEIFERINASAVKSTPEVYVRTNFIGYSWNGFWYSFHRTNFAMDVVQPEVSDRTQNVEVNSEFPALLTVAGYPIIVDTSADLAIYAHDGTKPVTGVPLTMSTPIAKQMAMPFVEKFTGFLESELRKKYDTVNSRVSGVQNPAKAHREITVAIQAFNSADLKGVRIVFQLNEEQEKLQFLNVSLLDSDINGFNKKTLAASSKDLVRSNGQFFTELDGFKLNDAVLLTEIDALGRGEATVQFLNSDVGAMVERASYVEQGVFEVPVDNRPKPRNQSFVSVAATGAVLGLQTIAGGEGQTIARIVSISTDNVYGKIQDICGFDSNFYVKIGMTDQEVLGRILTAIEAKQAADPTYRCDHIKVRDNGSLGLIKSIYFPNERLVLMFSNRGLSTANIYLPMTELDLNLPEVIQ